jgi:hypothetical protein
MSATMKLSRRLGGAAYATTKWPISIDGNVVGSVGHGETLEIPVKPGHHTLRLGSKRHLSPEQSFLATEGEVVSFDCRGRFTVGIWVVALFKPDLWISLRQVT